MESPTDPVVQFWDIASIWISAFMIGLGAAWLMVKANRHTDIDEEDRS